MMIRSQLILLILPLFLCNCNSEDVVTIQKDAPTYIFPDRLKGQWITENGNWGFELDKSGVIDFIGLDTKTGQFVNYLDEVDSIFFIDSARFVLVPVNCFFESVFEDYVPLDTGIYYLNQDSLYFEFFEYYPGQQRVGLSFTKSQDRLFEPNASCVGATIALENGIIQFESHRLFYAGSGFLMTEDKNELVIESKMSDYDCILYSTNEITEVLLVIENYNGKGTYSLKLPGEERIWPEASLLTRWFGDVGYQYFLFGEIEIIEYSDSILIGNFSATFYLDSDSVGTGSIENGQLEIYP